MASYREKMSVQLKSVDHLTSAERADVAEASRKVRPNARLRRQFAELRQARNELFRSRADSKKPSPEFERLFLRERLGPQAPAGNVVPIEIDGRPTVR